MVRSHRHSPGSSTVQTVGEHPSITKQSRSSRITCLLRPGRVTEPFPLREFKQIGRREKPVMPADIHAACRADVRQRSRPSVRHVLRHALTFLGDEVGAFPLEQGAQQDDLARQTAAVLKTDRGSGGREVYRRQHRATDRMATRQREYSATEPSKEDMSRPCHRHETAQLFTVDTWRQVADRWLPGVLGLNHQIVQETRAAADGK